jgi:hypothetical protein
VSCQIHIVRGCIDSDPEGCTKVSASWKAFILQTCRVEDLVAECGTTENCYLLLTVRGREGDMSEDQVTAPCVVTLRGDVGYLPCGYMVLQCRRL